MRNVGWKALIVKALLKPPRAREAKLFLSRSSNTCMNRTGIFASLLCLACERRNLVEIWLCVSNCHGIQVGGENACCLRSPSQMLVSANNATREEVEHPVERRWYHVRYYTRIFSDAQKEMSGAHFLGENSTILPQNKFWYWVLLPTVLAFCSGATFLWSGHALHRVPRCADESATQARRLLIWHWAEVWWQCAEPVVV